MLWIVLALATAFFNASAATLAKRGLSELQPWEMGMIPTAYAGLFCLVLLPLIEIPELDAAFWWAWGLSLPLMVVALYFQFSAIQLSPLSLTMPYLSFTPAFVIFTGFVLLGEVLNLWGILGVLSIAAGGYVLNVELGSGRGLLDPVKAVFREPGSWRMLVTAGIFSLTGVFGRMGVLHSSPMFFALTMLPALGSLFVATGFLLGRARISSLWKKPRSALLAGLCVALEIICHHFSIALAKSAYMLAVKRLNTLISVIFGRFVFKERNIAVRLSGTLLMILGVAMIGLLGK
ncbi:MAG: DMT family transporter [Desulfohalobiaceae bacterium]|nr:DMT family transporter [Desulfohalobiaceae bacterium]